MEPIKFKKLEIKQEGNRFKRMVKAAYFKRTMLYCCLGMLVAYALFYFGQEGSDIVFWNDKAAENVFIGLGFGVFLSTSPCARGRCS